MKKLPRIISMTEYDKIISYCMKTKFKNYKQYVLAFMLGFEAGMRISEIVGYQGKSKRRNKITKEVIVTDVNIPALTIDKIDTEQHTIKVTSGKGGKDRIVPLPKRIDAKALKLLPLTIQRRIIQRRITRIGKIVLNKDISFHTLRHGFATHLVNSGRPLHELQMLMGHSRLDTTSIYLHSSPKDAVRGARDAFEW